MHSNTFNTMQCISPNALYSPLDCNHHNALPPNPLHCSQCSVLHSTSCHQCTAMPSMHCRQCALAGIACFTARASTTFLFPPIYCSSLALCCSSICCTALPLAATAAAALCCRHFAAAQPAALPLLATAASTLPCRHFAAASTCCSATATARHCCCASLFA